jgi:hypothetical protein
VTRLPDVGQSLAVHAPDTIDHAGSDIIDWTRAALPATQGVWHAYEQAVGQMPAFLPGSGMNSVVSRD